MRKLYMLSVTLLAFVCGWSQTTYYWKPQSGSWNNPANWTTSSTGVGGTARNTPAANDILVIDKGVQTSISNVQNETIGKLLILSGEVTLSAQPGIQILTIGNGSGTDLVVEDDAKLIQDVSLNYIVLANSATASIVGEYRIDAEYYINSTNSLTTVTGLIDNHGTITGANTSRLIFNGGTYNHAQNGGSVPSASWNSGSVVRLSGMTTQYPGNMGQSFRNVVFDGSITSDVVIGTDLTCLEDLTVNFSFGAGDELRLTSSNPNVDVRVDGAFKLINGTLNLDNGNGGSTLTVSGDFIQSGGTLTETGTGSASVFFDGTAIQNFTKTGGTISQTLNFTVNSNAIVNFGTSVLNGSTGTFTLANNATLITAHAAGLSSTGATGSIQVTGTRTYSNTANYEFRGAATGAFATTGNEVRNLVIANTSGEVLAQRTFIVNGALTLTNGHFTTSAGQLTVSTTGTASTSNGAFVNGPMAKNTNSAAAFTFPVGKVSGGLRTIGITTTTSSASTFTAEFFRGVPPTAPLAATLTQKSACEYWDLARPSGAPARVTLSWAANSSCSSTDYITQLSSLRVAHLTGGTWKDEGYQASSGTTTAGTVTSSVAMTTFSPFALASNSATENPLPVEFANVKAFEQNNGVQIEWSNLTEKDVANYSVERSVNGSNFDAIAQLLPSNNQNDKADYSSFDANPVQGTSYYRIKAIETTGKIVYSKIMTVTTGATVSGLRVYPNPASGSELTISLSNVKRGQYTLRLVNAAGQDAYTQSINSQGTTLTQTVRLSSAIKPGVYHLLVTGADYRQTRTLVIQK